MASEARSRRRTPHCTSPLFTRALGAACLAGATRLAAAFITPGCSGFYGINYAAVSVAIPAAKDSTAIATVHRHSKQGGGGGSCDGPSRRCRKSKLAMVTATAEAPGVMYSPVTAVDARAARTSGRRGPRPPPSLPLTIDEERALLFKIKDARLLRGAHRRLELAATAGNQGNQVDGKGAADGGAGTAVTMQSLAREAGLEVQDISRVLQEGIEAKRTLVERNMPMVTRMVEGQYRWRLRGGQVSFSDLLQEGAYALGVAAEQFDPAMRNRFLTYALYTVRDKLDNALAGGNSAISVPATALKELYRARRELTCELGRSPSEAELANFFADGVVDGRAPEATMAAAATLVEGGVGSLGGRSAVAERGMGGRSTAFGGDFSAKVPSNYRETRQQARTRRRRLNLLSAVHKAVSIDCLIRASDGTSMVPLVETLAEDLGYDPLLAADEIAQLLPRVLTPPQASLVRMACGLADERPMSMAECSKELSLSLAMTKSLFDSSLEKLRIAAKADNPSTMVRKA